MLLAIGTWAFWLLRAPGQLERGSVSSEGLRLPAPGQPVHLRARGKTLVVYVFSGSDPEYADNLRFFISQAVQVRIGGCGGGGRRRRCQLPCTGPSCPRAADSRTHLRMHPRTPSRRRTTAATM